MAKKKIILMTGGIGLEFAKKAYENGETLTAYGSRKNQKYPYGTLLAGNIFEHPGDHSARVDHLLEQGVGTFVLNAAYNMDNDEEESQQNSFDQQMMFFTKMLGYILFNDEIKNFTLLYISSITVAMDKQGAIPEKRKTTYVKMKVAQYDLLMQYADTLRSKGIKLIILQPGAIDTDMMDHLTPEKAVKLANMFGKKCNMIQDVIFTAEEIGKFMCHILKIYSSITLPEPKIIPLFNHDQLGGSIEQ